MLKKFVLPFILGVFLLTSGASAFAEGGGCKQAAEQKAASCQCCCCKCATCCKCAK